MSTHADGATPPMSGEAQRNPAIPMEQPRRLDHKWPSRDRLHVLVEAIHPYSRATRVELRDFRAPVGVCQAMPICTGVALLALQVTPTP